MPVLLRRPGVAGAPPPRQVHVQFGADAASQVAVSWAVPAAVARPRLRIGHAGSGPCGTEVAAEERGYTDALTGQLVRTFHARLGGLGAGTDFRYEVVHDGAKPVAGSFRTGPGGRSGPFRFTSFGDQSIPAPVGRGIGPASVNAGYVVAAVNTLNPLFHLLNGDLAYANVSDAPVRTWSSFFANNMRSARHRAWMPAAGNHENEAGNGPTGYLAYQSRFALPPNGSAEFAGLWYAFTVGPVRVVSLQGDDVCLQDAGFSSYRRDQLAGYRARGLDPYVRGYSGGEQRAWLERELAGAQADPGIDWIVVCMHQVAMSSARFNGADLGIRKEFLPLFDAYRVDLVLAGHEHHYERTFPVRGVLAGSELLTPAPQGSDPAELDTSAGAVHMIIGGGGNPGPTTAAQLAAPGHGVLITGVRPGSPQRQRPPVTATEPAPWSAYRDLQRPYGFACFDVVPVEAGGTTSITVTRYAAAAGSPSYRPADRFVLRKALPGWPAPAASGPPRYLRVTGQCADVGRRSVRVLVIRHHAVDSPGFIADAFTARGAQLTMHLFPQDGELPGLAGFDHVVVLGSTASVYDDGEARGWIDAELDWLRQADQAGVPVLGICFGAQALAAALGGAVRAAARREVGWTLVRTEDDALVPAGPWLEFHGDICLPPAAARVLASNDNGVQAFCLGRHLAVQFHPEVDGAQLRLWLDNGSREEAEQAGHDPDLLLRQTFAQEPAARIRAGKLVAAALGIAAQAGASSSTRPCSSPT